MPQKVGSIADYDPVNGQWGSIGQNQPQQQHQAYHQQQVRAPQAYQAPPQQQPQMISPGSMGSMPSPAGQPMQQKVQRSQVSQSLFATVILLT